MCSYTTHLLLAATPPLPSQSNWRRNLASECLGLVARVLPEDCIEGARGDARGVRPLGAEGYESLYDALCHVHDTRDSNRTFPIGGILAIVVMAMNAPEAPTEAPRPHSVRMDGHESAPN